MCAPHELGMEQSTISRFNSQSTTRTVVGSDNGIISPIFSLLEDNSGQLPIVQTRDSKQWIDLDYLSPKILKELRKQYDPSVQDEPNSALVKGAAKVKAWVRQSKLGVEIRLRRKINPGHDEVTDIHLVPDGPSSRYDYPDEKPTTMAELDGVQNQVIAELPEELTELPDSAVRSELGAGVAPSRTSTGSSIGEPLPKYEARQDPGLSQNVSGPGAERTASPERSAELNDHSFSLEDSISVPPKGGLSSVDLTANNAIRVFAPLDENLKATKPTDDESRQSIEISAVVPTSKLSVLNQQTKEDASLSQELQDIIKALRQEDLKYHAAPEKEQHGGELEPPNALLGHLKVAKRATYETETDVEPESPSRRKATKAVRKKSLAVPKRKRSNVTGKPSTVRAFKSSTGSDDERTDPDEGSLFRRQTLPKRLPANAGAEAIWASLLHMQSLMLGPEHPLTYQTKSDLAQSRANGHANCFEDLASLRKSKTLATETLGIVHPWVAAFSEDIARLERLTESQNKLGTKSKPENGGSSVSVSPTESALQIELLSPGEQPKQSRNTELSEDATHSHQSRSTETTAPKLAVDTQVLVSHPSNTGTLYNSRRPPHKLRSQAMQLPYLVLGACLKSARRGLLWLERNYGPEQPVETGKVRVRWTCSCGELLHDDFVERRSGAARELEAYLNRPTPVARGSGSPTSPGSSNGSRSIGNSSFGGAPSTQTSWSSYNSREQAFLTGNRDTKAPPVVTGVSSYPPYSPLPEPPWLLTCTNEDRYTPKLAHLDMAPYKINSDKDLALSLREHYFHVNKKWWRSLRIRGLNTIEFIQFEVHQNRFVDVRKCPDVPPLPTPDYSFEPGDLLPPVRSHYLLHLFKHPEDYDGELITYLRAPKRHGRLQLGVGWGINLVEGFLADRVWLVLSAFFALGSLAFMIAWAWKRDDVQGASGVAAWMVALVLLAFGWLQAFLG